MKYNNVFKTLAINSQKDENYLYIYEELNYKNVVGGTLLETDIVSTVFNDNLQINIDIIKQMDNVRNNGYYLAVFCNNIRLKIEGDGTLEEFETIAKNISLVKGK